MRWRFVAIVVVIGSVALAATLRIAHRADSVDVSVAAASFQDVEDQVTTNGTVEPTKEFQARAFWPGIVQQIYVELGDKVRPGQMLVSMKDPFAISRLTAANAALQGALVGDENIRRGGSEENLIDLRGNLEQAELSQAEAAKSAAELEQLHKSGAASAAEVNAAEEKLHSASATVATLKQKSINPYRPGDLKEADARVADARATLDAARNQFNNANISSPMAGTVYSIKVVPYDFVPVGADLVRVANLNQIQVRAYFDEPEIGKLAAGQPVTITWDGRPDRTWHGHIKQAPIAAMALGPRSVGECLIAVDDAKEDLLPNTNVMVTVTIQRHLHVLAIPRAALRTDGASNYVYRVVDGRLRQTSVDVGLVNLDRAEITRGLSQGDAVVLGAALGGAELRDGMAVRVEPSASSGSRSIASWLSASTFTP